MIRWFVQPLAALGFAVGLLYLGQIVGDLSGFTPPEWLPHWVQLDIGYVNGLSSEIGGSGIDALLVGGIAGFVVARMNRQRDAEQQRASLRRRFRFSGKVDLETELKTGAARLPLVGFEFNDDTIDDADIVSPRFFEHPWSTRFRSLNAPVKSLLDNVIFQGCQIKGARFGGATGGVELKQCQFASCEIHASDFRNCKFTNKAGTEPFVDTKLSRCKFNGATFIKCNMAEVEVRWCSYWGSTFEGSHLPGGLFDALDEAGCIVRDASKPGIYRVRSLWELFRAPTLGRAVFLIRYWFGARFPKN